MAFRTPSALAVSLAFAVLLACGCFNLDLPAGVIVRCDDGDCPSEFQCSTRTGLCVPRAPPADITPPTVSLSGVSPLRAGRGTQLTLTIDVATDPRAGLAAAPTLSVQDALGTTILSPIAGDHLAGDRAFTFSYTVGVAERSASLPLRALVIDTFDDDQDVALAPIALDLDGPTLAEADVVLAPPTPQTHVKGGDVVSLSLGALEAGAFVTSARLAQGASTVAAFVVDETGRLQPLTLPGLVSDLPLVAEVELSDDLGNVAISRSAPLAVDLTPPALTPADVDGVPVLVIDASVALSVSIVAGRAVDVVAFCVDGDVTPTADCDVADADFTPAASALTVGVAPGVGEKALRLVGVDRAGHRADATVSFVLAPTGALTALTLSPPSGQTSVKVGDAVTVTGTIAAGATVVGSFADADDLGRRLPGIIDIFADTEGAVAATVQVPPGAQDGRALVLVVQPSFFLQDGRIVSLPDELTATTLPVDLTRPVVDLDVVGGAVQPTRDVTIAWTASGAVAAVVTGDVDEVSDFVGLSDTATVSGSLAVRLSAGDGDKVVQVTAIDGADNVAFAQVNLRVDSTIPQVSLSLTNQLRPGVLGARVGSTLKLQGTTTDNNAPQLALLAFDGAGQELIACRRSLLPLLSPVAGGGFNVDVPAPIIVAACAGAATLRAELIVRNAAGTPSIAAFSRSVVDVDGDGVAEATALYYDDVPPVVASVTVDFDRAVPPGLDAVDDTSGGGNVLVTPTRALAVSIDASDAHPITGTIAGNVGVVGPFALPAEPQAASLVGGEGDKEIDVIVTDEVGNETRPPRVSLVLDTVRPAIMQVTATSYREVPAAGDLEAEDLLSTFVIAGVGGAVESRARVFAFRAGDNVASAAPLAVAEADLAGAFGDLDVTELDAPVVDLDLVVVDRAGNRSNALRVTRPRFTLSVPANPLGPRQATSLVTLLTAGTLAGPPTLEVISADGDPLSPDPGDLNIGGGAPIFLATVALDADDGLDEGVATAAIRVGGRAPNLHPASVSIDGVALDVDFTPPTITRGALRIDEGGALDTIAGLAGAVVDLAGSAPRDVVGFTVIVMNAANQVIGTRGARADGSFEAIEVAGGVMPEQVRVRVERDAADNLGAVLTLAAPAITNFVVAPSRARAGDTVNVTFRVDAVALAAPVVTIDGVAASQLSATVAAGATSFAYSHVVPATATNGDKGVLVNVTNDIGHARAASAVITFDVDPPELALLNPPAGATNQQTLVATVDDESAPTVTTATLVDVGTGLFFDGTTFSSVTPVALADQDGDAATYRRTVPALVNGRRYELTLTSTDAVANVATLEREFRFDTSPPLVSFHVEPASGRSVEVAYDLTVDDQNATVGCVVDDGPELACEVRGVVRAPFGVGRVLSFRVRDEAGNETTVVANPVTLTPRRVMAGADGAICTVDITADGVAGDITCWGDNRTGFLGAPLVTGPDQVGPGAGPPIGVIPPTAVWTTQGPWRSVAVGGDVICAVPAGGGLQCWGRRGDLIPRDPALLPPPAGSDLLLSPLSMPDGSSAERVAMSSTHGCLARDGQLRCWGATPLTTRPGGQRFDDEFLGSGVPRAIGVGEAHACALSADGIEVRCIGRNTHGQLGPSVPFGTQQPGGVTVASAAPDGIEELSVGPRQTCFRRRGALQVECFGDNSGGALQVAPFGGFNGDLTLQPITINGLGGALALASSQTATCAVGRDGAIRCLGTGALGDGSADSLARAVALFDTDETFDDVEVFGRTVCGVRSSDAGVVCAGESGRGEVTVSGFASGVTADLVAEGVALASRALCVTRQAGRACAGDNANNVWVAGDDGFTSCTVDADCGVGRECVDFGFGRFCEMASSMPFAATLITVDVLPSQVVMSNAFGCAMSLNSGVRCAGQPGRFLGTGNALQQLPTRLPRPERVLVDEQPRIELTGATALFGADAGVCAKAPPNQGGGPGGGEGVLHCWGDGTPGASSDTAQQVLDTARVQHVAFGAAHSCLAVDEGPEAPIRCSGNDSLGQLGNGTGTGAVVFASNQQLLRVRTFPDRRSFAAAGDVSCAIVESGDRRVHCWGDHRSPLFADAVPVPDAPVTAAIPLDDGQNGYSNARWIDIDGDTACIVSFDGRLRCWGAPLVPTSIVTATSSLTEVPTPLDLSFLTVDVTDGGACGVVEDTNSGQRVVHCVGANIAGRFGAGAGVAFSPVEVLQ